MLTFYGGCALPNGVPETDLGTGLIVLIGKEEGAGLLTCGSVNPLLRTCIGDATQRAAFNVLRSVPDLPTSVALALARAGFTLCDLFNG